MPFSLINLLNSSIGIVPYSGSLPQSSVSKVDYFLPSYLLVLLVQIEFWNILLTFWNCSERREYTGLLLWLIAHRKSFFMCCELSCTAFLWTFILPYLLISRVGEQTSVELKRYFHTMFTYKSYFHTYYIHREKSCLFSYRWYFLRVCPCTNKEAIKNVYICLACCWIFFILEPIFIFLKKKLKPLVKCHIERENPKTLTSILNTVKTVAWLNLNNLLTSKSFT